MPRVRGRVCIVVVLGAAAFFTAAPGARAGAQPAIVFIAPQQVSTDTQDALEDALGAQISLVGARLFFSAASDTAGGLERMLARAKKLAKEHAALGVLWLDAQPSGRWFLYIMDGSSDQIVVRPLSTDSDSLEATIEAVAVIARSASEALIARFELAGLPPPDSSAVMLEEPDDALRLEAGYAGFTFSPSMPWVSGIALGIAWQWPSGPYAGLNYVWFPAQDVDVPAVRFSVTPYPISVRSGYRIQLLPWLRLSAEISAGVEFRARQTERTITELTDRGDSTNPVYFLGVGATADIRITDWLSFTARLSPEAVFQTRDYVSDPRIPESPRPPYLLLGPNRQRFTAQLGLAIIR